MLLPILLIITTILIVVLSLLLVEKNNTIDTFESETNSLKKSLCDLELQKSKFQKEIKKDKDKLQEELCVVKKN